MKELNIYEIDNEIRDITDSLTEVLEESGGEITEEVITLMDKLDSLEINREKKIEGACLIKRETDASVRALKDEIKRIDKKVKALENKSNSLKGYVESALNGEKFKTTLVNVYYRKSEAVEIKDIEAIPDELIKIERTAKKTDIKKRIKEGWKVPGAVLEERFSTIIR